MAEEGYDARRETLVMERKTIWAPGCNHLPPEEKQRIARELHAHPDQAAKVAYERTHTGFCRIIEVTADDVERLGGQRIGPL